MFFLCILLSVEEYHQAVRPEGEAVGPQSGPEDGLLRRGAAQEEARAQEQGRTQA